MSFIVKCYMLAVCAGVPSAVWPKKRPPEGADGDADVTAEERSSSRGLVPRTFSTYLQKKQCFSKFRVRENMIMLIVVAR